MLSDSISSKTEEQPYCKIDEQNPPADLFHDQPRYEMCRIPDPSMTVMHGFPIVVLQMEQSNSPLRTQLSSDTFQLAYYSSHGNLLQPINENPNGKNIKKALIMIHGSGRNAEDYFCVALSLVPKDERDSVLVIAPKFLAPVDISGINNQTNFLIWQEDEAPPEYPMAHSWRYGADALNGPVSSYGAIDHLVKYLSTASKFPNLKLVSIAGHSAGGQVAHRWALLSEIKATRTCMLPQVEIRAVAANPRSYCYLNGKRMILDQETNITRLDYPSAKEVQHCPDYNQWNWGLEGGGDLDPVVPYK
ncbi:MAG: hypothetical protein SGBAC_006141, partial [Bacillariaceae sp.]